MVMGPATIVVLLTAGVLFLLGVLIINAGRRGRAPGATCACGHLNPRRARYCAHCGEKLNGPDTSSENRE